jgi:hypothetical protein
MFGFLTVMDIKVAVSCIVTSCVLDICRMLEQSAASVIRVNDENKGLSEKSAFFYQYARHLLEDNSPSHKGLIMGDAEMSL